MKKRIGIKDIAERLNISVSTVSRALRDAHDVNKDTRKKVLDLAETLNFKLNKNASALASGATRNIGVVIPFITNYYFSTVISGIQEQAFDKGYNIILYVTNDDKEREKQLLHNIDSASLDGLLISISSNTVMQDHFERLISDGMSIVFFDRVPKKIAASRVLQDDFEGAFLATQYLIKSGYKKIAHIAGPESLNFTQQRLDGYKHALNQYNIAYRKEYVIYSGFSQQDGSADTKRLMKLPDPPNGIFAANDRKAVGAILTLKKHKIKVGRDVGVIGFTNDPISKVIEPNLTTIEEPAFEIGKQSCDLLIKHIKNKNYEPMDIILPSKLIIRDSV